LWDSFSSAGTGSNVGLSAGNPLTGLTNRSGTLGGSISGATYIFPVSAAGKKFLCTYTGFLTLNSAFVAASVKGPELTTTVGGDRVSMLNGTCVLLSNVPATNSTYTASGTRANNAVISQVLVLATSAPTVLEINAATSTAIGHVDDASLTVVQVDLAFAN